MIRQCCSRLLTYIQDEGKRKRSTCNGHYLNTNPLWPPGYNRSVWLVGQSAPEIDIIIIISYTPQT